jgi:hypothetical protein
MHPCSEYTLLWSTQPLLSLSLTPLPPIPLFQQLSIPTLISSTFTDVMFYNIVDALSFSFLSFPEKHRVVSLLQTCSTFEFVYDHACFCVYVFLLDLYSMYDTKYVANIFKWPTGTVLTNCFPCTNFDLATKVPSMQNI